MTRALQRIKKLQNSVWRCDGADKVSSTEYVSAVAHILIDPLRQKPGSSSDNLLYSSLNG